MEALLALPLEWRLCLLVLAVIVVLLPSGVLLRRRRAAPRGPAFATLADLVGWLAARLEQQQDAAVWDALQEPEPDLPYALASLREAHRATPLATLYAGQELPVSGAEATLGGHDRELGHVHVVLVRHPDGWRLRRLFQCR